MSGESHVKPGPSRPLMAAASGDHVCMLYESDAERTAALAPLVRDALARGERVLVAADPGLLEALGAVGFASDGERLRGALVVGAPGDEGLLSWLEQAERQALQEGFTGLCVVGAGLGGGEAAPEARLDRYIAGSRTLAVCTYNPSQLSAPALRDVLRTHGLAVVGDRLCRNGFHEPPALVLGEADEAARAQWMLDELTRACEREAAAEAEISRRGALTEHILRHVPVGISYMDSDFVYHWVNPVQARLWEMPVERVIGRSVFEVFGPATYEQLGPILQAVFDTGEPYVGNAFPFVYTHDTDSRISYWDFIYQPVDGPDGVQGILVVAVESSERVEADKRQQARMAELAENDAHKDQFLSILSHELRTPLNAIMGFSSLLDDEVPGSLNTEQHAMLRKILGGTDVLLALIDDLLDTSRIQAGKFMVKAAPVAIAPVVHGVLANLGGLAEKTGTRLEAVVPEALPATLADQQRIAQVLTNLVGNAIKFSEPGGLVRVSLGVEGSRLRCDVCDHGPGIPTEDRARLFEPFFQLDKPSPVKGTGLGLAIAKAIVEAHHGTIGVESAPGAGSTFWFTLPLA